MESTPMGPSHTQVVLGGFLLETTLRCDVGGGTIADVLFQWSYDRFMKTYRVAITEGAFGYMDIYEGVFDENGNLQLSNENMGTPISTPEGTFAAKYKLTFHDATQGPGYTLTGTYSGDHGKTWYGSTDMRFDPVK